MTDKVPIRQLPTGVPGLDEVLGGGLPEFSFNLIAGAPGSGKTTLAQQIMFTLAEPARPATIKAVRTGPSSMISVRETADPSIPSAPNLFNE